MMIPFLIRCKTFYLLHSYAMIKLLPVSTNKEAILMIKKFVRCTILGKMKPFFHFPYRQNGTQNCKMFSKMWTFTKYYMYFIFFSNTVFRHFTLLKSERFTLFLPLIFDKILLLPDIRARNWGYLRLLKPTISARSQYSNRLLQCFRYTNAIFAKGFDGSDCHVVIGANQCLWQFFT